jgi:hypothetical protein
VGAESLFHSIFHERVENFGPKSAPALETRCESARTTKAARIKGGLLKI